MKNIKVTYTSGKFLIDGLEIVNPEFIKDLVQDDGGVYFFLSTAHNLREGETFDLPIGLSYEIKDQFSPEGTPFMQWKVILLIPSLNNEEPYSKETPEVLIREPEIEESQEYTYDKLMYEWGQHECGTEPLQWLLNNFTIKRKKYI